MIKKLHVFLTFLILLILQDLNFAQVNLGATFSFALFTANGAFDNAGVTSTTNVTGDVGTNAGAFTAFPSGTVVGQIHVIDAVSLQAATDVNTAYTYLSGITCDSTLGTTIGNGQVLSPKVYCVGASIINGDLTLDGQGNPNALFIFKIDGALTANASSNIILINTASLDNVYWQINGAFDLGTGSVFKGTIIANGAIDLFDNSSLFGRGLTCAGAISLNNNLVDRGSTPLPVNLFNFFANTVGTNVQLNWSTLSETNNNYFTILRSIDGISFKELLRIDGAGNSNTVIHYSAFDYNPFKGTLYYRIKQTDFDGKFTYSNIIAVVFEKLFDFIIYPNPFCVFTTITINDASPNNMYELRIYNISGTEVLKTIISSQKSYLNTKNLSSNIYFYKLFNNNEFIKSGKLISQK